MGGGRPCPIPVQRTPASIACAVCARKCTPVSRILPRLSIGHLNTYACVPLPPPPPVPSLPLSFRAAVAWRLFFGAAASPSGLPPPPWQRDLFPRAGTYHASLSSSPRAALFFFSGGTVAHHGTPSLHPAHPPGGTGGDHPSLAITRRWRARQAPPPLAVATTVATTLPLPRGRATPAPAVAPPVTHIGGRKHSRRHRRCRCCCGRRYDGRERGAGGQAPPVCGVGPGGVVVAAAAAAATAAASSPRIRYRCRPVGCVGCPCRGRVGPGPSAAAAAAAAGISGRAHGRVHSGGAGVGACDAGTIHARIGGSRGSRRQCCGDGCRRRRRRARCGARVDGEHMGGAAADVLWWVSPLGRAEVTTQWSRGGASFSRSCCPFSFVLCLVLSWGRRRGALHSAPAHDNDGVADFGSAPRGLRSLRRSASRIVQVSNVNCCVHISIGQDQISQCFRFVSTHSSSNARSDGNEISTGQTHPIEILRYQKKRH